MSDPYAEKPWLKHYDDHVPPSLNYSNKTYPELFREATTLIPARTAVYYMGRAITYYELDKLSNRFAHFLKNRGLNPGDTVGVNLPTIYLELLKKPKFRSLDFSGVQWCISGAAPFPPEYIKEFEEVVGEGKLVEVLGMTETSPVHMGLPRYGMKKPGSIGIPFPDTEVKLIDPDAGESSALQSSQ